MNTLLHSKCTLLLHTQVLVTCNDFMDKDFKHNLCATVEDLLQMGTVPIFNENDSISKGAKAKKVVSAVSRALSCRVCPHTLDI